MAGTKDIRLKRDAELPTIMLTGVTGFLGQELLYQLLTETEARVVCLIRADDTLKANARLDEICRKLFGRGGLGSARERLRAVHGDLTEPDVGLSPRVREHLVHEVTHILHGAASVRFDLPLSDARDINVQGTMAMLDLALDACNHGRLERFAYISTAFVSGRHPGWFSEDDLDVGQRFRNSYERSKFEAELVVHAYMRNLPATVVRPSIVVGNSRSGATSAFNVIYWPLRIYADGILRYAPAAPELPVDLVPVDFVARGAIEAIFGGEAGETYTLAAGEGATKASAIGEMASRVFSTRPPRLLFTPFDRLLVPALTPMLSVGPWKRFGKSIRQYMPYFLDGSRFDTAHADALLRPRGIKPPPVSQFLEPVLEFARSTDFGRDHAAIVAHERTLSRARRNALAHAPGRARTPRRRPAPARV